MRLEQRIGRVDRIGQQRAVHAIHLIARSTSEPHILDRLKTRLTRARAELDVPDPVSSEHERRIAALVIGALSRSEEPVAGQSEPLAGCGRQPQPFQHARSADGGCPGGRPNRGVTIDHREYTVGLAARSRRRCRNAADSARPGCALPRCTLCSRRSDVDVYFNDILAVKNLKFPSVSQWITVQPGTDTRRHCADGQPASAAVIAPINARHERRFLADGRRHSAPAAAP